MNRDNMANYEDLLPQGALPMCGFRLLSYINSKGEICYQFSQVGDVAVSQLLGIIEMAKFDITRVASEAGLRRRNDEDD